MGGSWASIDLPKLTPHLLLTILVAAFKFTAITVPHYFVLQFINNIRAKYSNHHDYVQEAEVIARRRHASPSTLLPVPRISGVLSDLIKKKLPVMEFGEFQLRMAMDDHEDFLASSYYSCAVCLSCIKKGEEIRLLANCRHLYHRECMDAWMDHGNGTCPLCRVNLLPAHQAETDHPCREERVASLFDEDCVLDTF